MAKAGISQILNKWTDNHMDIQKHGHLMYSPGPTHSCIQYWFRYLNYWPRILVNSRHLSYRTIMTALHLAVVDGGSLVWTNAGHKSHSGGTLYMTAIV